MSAEAEIIQSIKHPLVVEARELSCGKGRRAKGKILVAGEEAIMWALNHNCRIHHIFIHDKIDEHPFLEKLQVMGVKHYFVSEGILRKISDTSYNIPFLAVIERVKKRREEKNDIVVVLDGVKDFGNLGTLCRTAFAFGIHQFYSTHPDLDLYYRKAIEASRGAVFGIRCYNWPSGPDLVHYLKDEGYQIVATTPHGSMIQSIAPLKDQPIALVFGSESDGVYDEVMEMADLKIQIPMSGEMESLNVGVSAGITMYEMKIKMVLLMLLEKIRSSLGRHLTVASRWTRQVFDHQLQNATPFNAEQAILMMIVRCDSAISPEQLRRDTGIQGPIEPLINPLIEMGYLKSNQEKLLVLTTSGQEALAKIWAIHEQAENLVLKGFSEEERGVLIDFLTRIQDNCERIIPFEE